MTDFISLKDGTLINLATVAWIDVDWTPRLPQEEVRNIVLTFSAAWGDEGGTYNKLEMPLEGVEADEFINELQRRGIDVAKLKAARAAKQPGIVQLGLLDGPADG